VDAWRSSVYIYSINGHITVSMTPTEITDKHPDFFMKRDNDGFLQSCLLRSGSRLHGRFRCRMVLCLVMMR